MALQHYYIWKKITKNWSQKKSCYVANCLANLSFISHHSKINPKNQKLFKNCLVSKEEVKIKRIKPLKNKTLLYESQSKRAKWVLYKIIFIVPLARTLRPYGTVIGLSATMVKTSCIIKWLEYLPNTLTEWFITCFLELDLIRSI